MTFSKVMLVASSRKGVSVPSEDHDDRGDPQMNSPSLGGSRHKA